MKLTPWRKHQASAHSQHGYNPVFGLRSDINSLFDNWLDGFWDQPFGESKGSFIPAIDMIQKDKFYQVNVELPGLKEDEIELVIEDNHMILKGERKDEKEENKQDYILKESKIGSFYRSFPLPNDVDTEQSGKASLKDGLLTIQLPKLKKAKSKKGKITIESS